MLMKSALVQVKKATFDQVTDCSVSFERWIALAMSDVTIKQDGAQCDAEGYLRTVLRAGLALFPG